MYDHVCTSTNLKDASDLLLCESINFLLFLGGSRIASLVNPDMVQQIAPFIFGQHSGWHCFASIQLWFHWRQEGSTFIQTPDPSHLALNKKQDKFSNWICHSLSLCMCSEGWNMAVTKLLDQTGLAFCCLSLPSRVNLLQELGMGLLKVQYDET